MDDVPPSEQIDAIIASQTDWRGELLSQLRDLVNAAGPGIVEEVKWKKPSRPEGVPVWSDHGIVCVADILKRSVRLTFPKGARIEDPTGLFNARLDSRTTRAIDFFEGVTLDGDAIAAIVRNGVSLNGG